MLSAKQLTKIFSRQLALSDVSVDVHSAGCLAVIGPSGCGKTTLLRCLARLESSDSGMVTLDGRLIEPIANLSAIPGFHPAVGFVFQGLSLWPHLTIRENILLATRVMHVPIDRTFTDYLIELFKVESILDKYPRQTSGGERQRAALIRAITLKPKYLLLDEITSALDVEQVANVVKVLRELREAGTGLMLVTHSIQLAKATSDRFIFMDKGEVVEAAGIDEIENAQSARLQEFMLSTKSRHAIP